MKSNTAIQEFRKEWFDGKFTTKEGHIDMTKIESFLSKELAQAEQRTREDFMLTIARLEIDIQFAMTHPRKRMVYLLVMKETIDKAWDKLRSSRKETKL